MKRQILATLLIFGLFLNNPVVFYGQDEPQKKQNEPTRGAPEAPQPPRKAKKAKDDVEKIGNRDTGKGINFYSLEKEVALGKALAQEIERQTKLMDDPVITEYVNRLGQNLVRNSDAKVPFTIKVIDSDELNAFALPGGFFYVNSGLVLAADNEAELAGVMAHEIAHVAARHGTKTATKAQMIQLASIGTIFIGGWPGYGVQQAMGYLIPLSFLQFGRAAERDADYRGLQYMYKAGYDPNGFVDFFAVIAAKEKKKPSKVPKVFSTHPPTPDRIEAAKKEIASILPEQPQYIVTTSEFEAVKKRLTDVQAGRKPKETDSTGPKLRTRTETQKQCDDQNKGSNGCEEKTDDDKPPILKKR